MALPSVSDAFYPTPDQVLSQLLTDARFAYKTLLGIDVNVSVGSDLWLRLKSLVPLVSIAIQNNKIKLADVSPLSAEGDNLTALAGVFGISRRPAASAAGFVVVECTGSVTIAEGDTCTAPNGTVYQTVTAATVSDGDTVEVIATTGGDDTNQTSGTVLQWNNGGTAFLKATCTVDSDGLVGGADADDDETLRARLLDRLSNAAVGGNWAQVAALAENASASVQKAFVYPCVRGPGSYDVAITSEDGDRTLSLATVNAVSSALNGQMPEPVDSNVTTVFPQEVDVIFDAKLPLPVSAGGAGGGWKDASPWPTSSTACVAPSAPAATYTFGTNTITAAINFYQYGFLPGMTITVAGTASNNGTYTIESMTSGVLTVDPHTNVEAIALIAGDISSADTSGPIRVISRAGTTITINLGTSPTLTAGQHFSIWNPDDEEMSEFVIQSVSQLSTGTTIVIDSAQSDAISFITEAVQTGGYFISASAANLNEYATEFLAAMKLLGPGEKTSSTSILPRGARKPGQDVGYPSALTNVQVGAITGEHPEILDLGYAKRLATETVTTLAEPSIPGTTADPPRILTLNHLGFRKA